MKRTFLYSLLLLVTSFLCSPVEAQFFVHTFSESDFWISSGISNWNDATSKIEFGAEGCTWSNIDGSRCPNVSSTHTGAADYAIKSEEIDITNRCNVQIEIDYRYDGDLECYFGAQRRLCPSIVTVGDYGHDQMFFDLRTDGGVWQEFGSFCENGNGRGRVASSTPINGNSLEIRISGGVQASTESIVLQQMQLKELGPVSPLKMPSFPSSLCVDNPEDNDPIMLPSKVQGYPGHWINRSGQRITTLDPNIYSAGNVASITFVPDLSGCWSRESLTSTVHMVSCRCPLMRIEDIDAKCLTPEDPENLSAYEQEISFSVQGKGNFNFSWQVLDQYANVIDSGTGHYVSDNRIKAMIPVFDSASLTIRPTLKVTDLSTRMDCQSSENHCLYIDLPSLDESTSTPCQIPNKTSLKNIRCAGHALTMDIYVDNPIATKGFFLICPDYLSGEDLMVSPRWIDYNKWTSIKIAPMTSSGHRLFNPSFYGVDHIRDPIAKPIPLFPVDSFLINPSLVLLNTDSEGDVLFSAVDAESIYCSDDAKTLRFEAAVQASYDPTGQLLPGSGAAFDGFYGISVADSNINLFPSKAKLTPLQNLNNEIKTQFTLTSPTPFTEELALNFYNHKIQDCASPWLLQTGCVQRVCAFKVIGAETTATCGEQGAIDLRITGFQSLPMVNVRRLPQDSALNPTIHRVLVSADTAQVSISNLKPGVYAIHMEDSSVPGCSLDTFFEVNMLDFRFNTRTNLLDCDSVFIEILSSGSDLSGVRYWLINETLSDSFPIGNPWGGRYHPGDSITIFGVDTVTGCSHRRTEILHASGNVIFKNVGIACNIDSTAYTLQVDFEDETGGLIQGFRFFSLPNGDIDTVLNFSNSSGFEFEVPLDFSESSLHVRDTNIFAADCDDVRPVPPLPTCLVPCSIEASAQQWSCDLLGDDYQYRLNYQIRVDGRSVDDQFDVEYNGLSIFLDRYSSSAPVLLRRQSIEPNSYLVFIDRLDRNCRDSLAVNEFLPNCCDSVWNFNDPTIHPARCNENNGSIAFHLDTSIYRVDWDDTSFPPGADSVSGLSPGTYQVRIRFPACPNDRVFNITLPSQDAFTFQGSSNAPSGPGEMDGSISLLCLDCEIPYHLIINEDSVLDIQSFEYNLSDLGDTLIEAIYIGPQSGCTDTLRFNLSSMCPQLHVSMDSTLSDFCQGIAYLRASSGTDLRAWRVRLNGGANRSFDSDSLIRFEGLENGLHTLTFVSGLSGVGTSCDSSFEFRIITPKIDSVEIVRKADCTSMTSLLRIHPDSLLSTWTIWARNENTGLVNAINPLTELAPGTYSFYISDGRGCNSPEIGPFEVGQLDSLHAFDIRQPTAPGVMDGQVGLGCIGCNIPYTLSVNGTSFSLYGDTTFMNLGDTVLYISLSNSLTGCTLYDTVVLESTCPSLGMYIDSSSSNFCANRYVIRFSDTIDFSLWNLSLNGADIISLLRGDSLPIIGFPQDVYHLKAHLKLGGLCDDSISFDNRKYSIDTVLILDSSTCRKPFTSIEFISPDSMQPGITYGWEETTSQTMHHSEVSTQEVEAGDYLFWVRSPNGCSSDTIGPLQILPAPSITLESDLIQEPSFTGNYEDGIIRIGCLGCSRDSFLLWKDGDSLGGFRTSYIDGTLDTMVHLYIIMDEKGCRDSLFVKPPPCTADPIRIETKNPTCDQPSSGAVFLRNLPDAPVVRFNGGIIQPPDSIEGLGPGVYSIEVESARSIDRCFQPYDTFVTLNLPLLLNHSWSGGSITIERGDSVRLPNGDPDLVGVANYRWVSPDGSEPCGFLLSCVVAPMETTTYTFVVDRESCDSPYLFTIIVEDPSPSPAILDYPNVLSTQNPALSRFALIDYSDRIESILLFQVFDRKGSIVWKERNIEDSNGRFSTAFDLVGNSRLSNLSTGVYPFLMETKLRTGTTHYIAGTIQIVD